MQRPLLKLPQAASGRWRHDAAITRSSMSGDTGGDLSKSKNETAMAQGGVLGRLRQLIFGGEDPKKRLAAMGAATLLSYGFVSNVNAACLITLSFLTFAKSTGLSLLGPVAPEQWIPIPLPRKAFLAVWVGFYMTSHLTRPFRIAGSIAISPIFSHSVAFFRKVLRVPNWVAFAATVIFFNVFVNCGLFALGLSTVSLITGVPLYSTVV
eukprot:gnl/MRDRNA2_/MRDRNA2_52129_c0_seq1.p1 gnl/MRDRNA2_/MRDRNA2_52129_c0~~gnl/MRDRNA2_/MRDRNA2_52129_c0_seq1.p1  ORF type:complete len:218 (-),score=24.26 gnl/MRDRNA2_/MRDRNA2_52129_c0_seq1:379-1005(-)